MIINIIILLLAGINIAFISMFGENFLNSNFEFKYIALALFFMSQVIVTLYAIRVFYEIPILELELTIKKVLSGKLKDERIKFRKSQNKHINYIMDFFSNTLNTLKNIKQEFLHGKEIKSEVELAKEIQGKSFNKKLIDVPSLNVVAKTKPAGEIGGDAYDIIKHEDNYYIYVGDATGHGIGAGFIMIMVNALVSGFSKIFKSGSDILGFTNEILKPRVKANLLMTMLLVRWDEKQKRVFMTGAGHEYLLIYKHKNKKCYKIKSGGIALGMVKDIRKLLKEKEIEFEANDIIVLYTDGITEATDKPKKDGTQKMFGEQRLMEAIEKAPNLKGKKYKSAISVFNNISINLSKFMGYKYRQADDITLVVMHYKTNDYSEDNDYSTEISDDFITEWMW